MSALKLMVGSLLLLGLAGCAQDSSPQAKVDTMNDKIVRMNSIALDLDRENLPLASKSLYSSTMNSVPNGLSSEKTTQLRSMLVEYINLGEAVLAKSNDKDVIWSSADQVKRNIAQARHYLQEMQGYEERELQAKQMRERQEAMDRIGRDKAELSREKALKMRELNAEATRIMKQIVSKYMISLIDEPQSKGPLGVSNASLTKNLAAADLDQLRVDSARVIQNYDECLRLIEDLKADSSASISSLLAAQSQITQTRASVLSNKKMIDDVYAARAGSSGTMLGTANPKRP